MNATVRTAPFPVPPYAYMRVRVKDVVRINRGWARIILAGPELADFVPTGVACWIKAFIPGPSGNIGRAYTVRHFDADACELEIDVVRRRRTGAMSQWMYDNLRPGDHIDIAGPRGGLVIDEEAAWHVVLGDETALPAIHCILEALPAHVPRTAIVEVPFPENTYASESQIDFLIRGINDGDRPSFLESAIETIPQRVGKGRVWIAGEAGLIRSLKKHAKQVWTRPDITIEATGYWKMGEQDYRDEVAYPL